MREGMSSTRKSTAIADAKYSQLPDGESKKKLSRGFFDRGRSLSVYLYLSEFKWSKILLMVAVVSFLTARLFASETMRGDKFRGSCRCFSRSMVSSGTVSLIMEKTVYRTRFSIYDGMANVRSSYLRTALRSTWTGLSSANRDEFSYGSR